jgi:2-polyprenyl-6-methoxyphenol hydroxylase-like FAD-dependent oxidoreductase
MKVLISGGGIAGNSLTFWLSKLGHDVTVIERFASLRTTGLQLDLRGYGIEVLKLMGLEQDFRDHMAPEQGMKSSIRKANAGLCFRQTNLEKAYRVSVPTLKLCEEIYVVSSMI